MEQVREPMGRAVAMMVLVTEAHPFDDGNGRVARLTSNAELSAANEVRIIIPTVYRNNYLAGLSGVSNGSDGQAMAAILEYAQRWTALVDWSTFDAARAVIDASHGFVDAGLAESTGRRLQLPT
jgi:fido (protein-threonine AMPylation protein)